MLIYLFYFTEYVSFLVASRQNIPLKPIKNTLKEKNHCAHEPISHPFGVIYYVFAFLF